MAKYEPPVEQKVFDWPLDQGEVIFPQWSGFGPRPAGPPGEFEEHEGLDMTAPLGAPVGACAPGRVTAVVLAGSPQDNGCGNSVWLKHLEDDDWKIQSGYHHLANAPLLAVGDNVAAGDQLGVVGATGNASGPHLCWQTLIRGVPWNPRQIIRDYGRPTDDR